MPLELIIKLKDKVCEEKWVFFPIGKCILSTHTNHKLF